MSPSPSPAVRRFGAFWAASTVWKIAALAAFVDLAAKLTGGLGR